MSLAAFVSTSTPSRCATCPTPSNKGQYLAPATPRIRLAFCVSRRNTRKQRDSGPFTFHTDTFESFVAGPGIGRFGCSRKGLFILRQEFFQNLELRQPQLDFECLFFGNF